MEFIIYGLNCETYGSLWVYAYVQSMGPSDSDSGAGNETGRPRDHGKAAELRCAKNPAVCVTL